MTLVLCHTFTLHAIDFDAFGIGHRMGYIIQLLTAGKKVSRLTGNLHLDSHCNLYFRLNQQMIAPLDEIERAKLLIKI